MLNLNSLSLSPINKHLPPGLRDAKLIIIDSKHPDWNAYIEMSHHYMASISSDNFDWLSEAEIEVEYQSKIKKFIQQEVRSTFLLRHPEKCIGFANSYIENGTLCIADFYIEEEYRRQGYGKQMYDLLLEWGREKNAKWLCIEVDKDLDRANSFWSSFRGITIDQSGDRNLYKKEL